MSQDTGATHTAHETTRALLELLTSIDGRPEFADLRDEAFWRIRGSSHELTGSVYTSHTVDKGMALLERWREWFGGSIGPTGEKYTDNWVWYALTTSVLRVPVVLKVPVEQPEVEQQLRERITELEAALDQARPVPYTLTGKADENVLPRVQTLQTALAGQHDQAVRDA